MKLYTTLLLLAFYLVSNAQDKYWVSYKDKACNTYSIEKPEVFMSENALARRTKFNIPINSTDIPVCKTYVSSIQKIGVEVNKNSKWLNASLVITDDESKIDQIRNLSFVKEVKKLSSKKQSPTSNKFQIKETPIVSNKNQSFDYGNGFNQIEMLKGNVLHDREYTGASIDIAVMDNGFPSVDTNIFYQRAFLDGRIIPAYDFVNDNDSLFDNKNGNHGNSVISTMVSFIEGELVGAAPDATYYLFSTEDNSNEGLQEEYNWALAAEMADSVLGTNAILSTSLGYSNGFDNSAEEHTYADMDGNTTPITIAADLAASKGFLVVNSAGNSGNSDWYYLTAPSDGDSVLCIGAVDSDGLVVGFSSRGPSSDGRVKPNVCAQGRNAIGVSTSGQLVSMSGTSFSCPITSGMAACLWQAFPGKSNMEIFDAIEKSANLYTMPNDSFGFGIPNFDIAYKILVDEFKEDLLVYPNPVVDELQFTVPEEFKNSEISIKIYDVLGNLIKEQNLFAIIQTEEISLPIGLPKGIYYLHLYKDKVKYKTKFVKN